MDDTSNDTSNIYDGDSPRNIDKHYNINKTVIIVAAMILIPDNITNISWLYN